MNSVKHFMIDAAWGQADLAKALDTTVSHISLLLCGKRQLSVQKLDRLHQITGIPLQILVAEMGKKPPRKRPIPKFNGDRPC